MGGCRVAGGGLPRNPDGADNATIPPPCILLQPMYAKRSPKRIIYRTLL